MSVKWLLQDVGFHRMIDNDFRNIQSLGYPYSSYGVLPFTNMLPGLENVLLSPQDVYVIRGGVKIIKVLDGINSLGEVNDFLSPEQLEFSAEYVKQLRAGVFYDIKTFDQAYYGGLDLPLLNKDAKLIEVKSNLNLTFVDDVFIKPSRDLKSFNAGVLEAGRTIMEHIDSHPHGVDYLDELAVIAPCQKIDSEYRFFVVNQEVITGSRYMLSGQLSLSNIIPDSVMAVAKEYARLYQPHDIFTMDLAETPKGVKIIEYNCWNASGLYNSDIKKIFSVVNEYKQAQSMNLVVKNRLC